MATIGIDLGTTNSAMAYLRNKPEIINIGNDQTMPSAAGFDPVNSEIVIGQAAKDNAEDYQTILSVKSRMGTNENFSLGPKTYKAEDISAMFLRKLVSTAEEVLEEPVDGAVITTPAYFGEPQNRATLKAAEDAGIGSVQLLAEPIAAALAFGLDNEDDIILVYDLGGGTFDVSVIDCFDFQMLGLAGNNRLGGDDFDDRLVEHLVKEIEKLNGVNIRNHPNAMRTAKEICENAKIKLSTNPSAKLQFMAEIDNQPVMYMGEITREQFESLIEDLVEDTLKKAQEAIENCKEKDSDFTKGNIDKVILVGGSTYIPVVRKRVQEYFGLEPSSKVNPDLAVAMGASIKTATMQENGNGPRVRLHPLPNVTNRTTQKVEGRTNPGATVNLSGFRGEPKTCVADGDGRFSTEVDIDPDSPTVIVAEVEANGEKRKSEVDVRHQSDFDGKEDTPDVGRGIGVTGLQPRAVGICLTGNKNYFRSIVKANSKTPCHEYGDGIGVSTGGAGNAPIIISEGTSPFALFNTIIGETSLSVPTSPDMPPQLPVDIIVRVDENRTVSIEASLPDYPDRIVKATFENKEIEPDKRALTERVEHFLTTYRNQMRPEHVSAITECQATFTDLEKSFGQNDDYNSPMYDRIVETGLKLTKLLEEMQQQYQHCHS